MSFNQSVDVQNRQRAVGLTIAGIAILAIALTATASGAMLTVEIAALTAGADSDLYAVGIQFEASETLDDSQLSTLDEAIEAELTDTFSERYRGSSVVSHSRLALFFTGTIDLQQVAEAIMPAFEQTVGADVDVSVRAGSNSGRGDHLQN